jgi:hypothetical protein
LHQPHQSVYKSTIIFLGLVLLSSTACSHVYHVRAGVRAVLLGVKLENNKNAPRKRIEIEIFFILIIDNGKLMIDIFLGEKKYYFLKK